MGCTSVRRESISLSEWIFYVQVDKHGKIIVDIAHHDIVRAKVGKAGINTAVTTLAGIKYDLCK